MKLPIRGETPRGFDEVRLPAHLIPDNTPVFKPTGTHCYRLMKSIKIYNVNGGPTVIRPTSDSGRLLIPLSPLTSPGINEVEWDTTLVAVLPTDVAKRLYAKHLRPITISTNELKHLLGLCQTGDPVHKHLEKLATEAMKHEETTDHRSDSSDNCVCHCPKCGRHN